MTMTTTIADSSSGLTTLPSSPANNKVAIDLDRTHPLLADAHSAPPTESPKPSPLQGLPACPRLARPSTERVPRKLSMLDLNQLKRPAKLAHAPAKSTAAHKRATKQPPQTADYENHRDEESGARHTECFTMFRLGTESADTTRSGSRNWLAPDRNLVFWVKSLLGPNNLGQNNLILTTIDERRRLT